MRFTYKSNSNYYQRRFHRKDKLTPIPTPTQTPTPLPITSVTM